MTIERMRAMIQAESDQDQEHCLAWFRSATPSDLMAVWEFIQRKQKNPVAEIVCRLAQLKFAEVFVTLPD